jgi:hypothetical protein
MRLDENPLLTTVAPEVADILRAQAVATNQVSEGKIDGVPNASTAAPTTGLYKQGDFVRNSTPVELGSVAAKYIVLGWMCTVSGVPNVSPGTFLPMRFLTGN